LEGDMQMTQAGAFGMNLLALTSYRRKRCCMSGVLACRIGPVLLIGLLLAVSSHAQRTTDATKMTTVTKPAAQTSTTDAADSAQADTPPSSAINQQRSNNSSGNISP